MSDEPTVLGVPARLVVWLRGSYGWERLGFAYLVLLGCFAVVPLVAGPHDLTKRIAATIVLLLSRGTLVAVLYVSARCWGEHLQRRKVAANGCGPILRWPDNFRFALSFVGIIGGAFTFALLHGVHPVYVVLHPDIVIDRTPLKALFAAGLALWTLLALTRR